MQIIDAHVHLDFPGKVEPLSGIMDSKEEFKKTIENSDLHELFPALETFRDFCAAWYVSKEQKLSQEDLTYNYDAIKKGRDKDVLLQPYDIIDVRNSGSFSGKNLKELFLNMSKGTMGFLPQRVLY